MATFTCPRCNGSGTVSFAKHYADGVCFACKGAGKLSASSKALNDAERAGLQINAMVAEAEARACTPKQDAFIWKIATRIGVSPGALVATANGMIAGYHSPEFTKDAVSKAIVMFKDMAPAKGRSVCYPKQAA